MKSLFLLLVVMLFSSNVFGQGTLSGKITDQKTGEPILFGDVVVYQNGALITGEQTDFDGNYRIDSIALGNYDLVIKYVGYKDTEIKNVQIFDDEESIVNASIEMSYQLITCGSIHYTIPLIEFDGFESGQTFTAKDIANMPIKN